MNIDMIIVNAISAIPPTALALASWLAARSTRKAAASLDGKVNDVHLIVNSQRDAMLLEIKTLRLEVAALKVQLLK